jgi:energy-coupling factor transporter ATP-binding protein EcfA2
MLPLYPYPGLRPYEDFDSKIFFGRKELTDRLYNKILKSRFVAVVGESGCGKSSLVKAGLFPKMSDLGYDIVKAKPGKSPLSNLVSSLSAFFSSWDNCFNNNQNLLSSNLNLNSNGLTEVYFQSNSQKPLLICIDQFEEIFDFAFDKTDSSKNNLQEATRFINLLISTSKQDEYEVYILITMRSDFVGVCSRFKGLPELVSEGQFLTPRLTRYQYQEAIVTPLTLFNYNIAPNVVSKMLNDIEDDPDQLPILQHTLRRIWEKKIKDSDKLQEVTIGDYLDVGGLNAIDTHANELFKSISSQKIDQDAKVLFKTLTELIISQNQEGGIRKPRKMVELMNLTGLPLDTINSVIETFSADGVNFLQVSYQDVRNNRDCIVDLSHESLIRKWPQLFSWMREEYNDKITLRRLVDEAASYKSKKTGLLSSRAVSWFKAWPKAQNKINFLRWAQRYANENEINDAFDFLNKSKLNTLKQKLFKGAPIAFLAIAMVAYLSSYQYLNKNYEILVGFTNREFRSFYTSVRENFGTYPAYLTASNWTQTSSQLLTLPLIHDSDPIKKLLDSLNKNVDSLKNIDPLFGVILDTKRNQRLSPNRKYEFSFDPYKSDSVSFIGLESNLRVSRYVGHVNLGTDIRITQDEKSFFMTTIDYFLEFHEKIVVSRIDTTETFEFELPGAQDNWQAVEDIISRGNGIYDIYIRKPLLSSAASKVPYSNYSKLRYSKKNGSLKKTTFNINLADPEGMYMEDSFLKKRYLAFTNRDGNWIVYDKLTDNFTSLPETFLGVPVKEVLYTTNNELIVVDDSCHVFYKGATLDAINVKYKNLGLSTEELSLIKDRWLVINGSKKNQRGFSQNRELIVYDLKQGLLHTMTTPIVSGQNYIPEIGDDYLVMIQTSNSNAPSFFWFFKNSTRRSVNWAIPQQLSDKYRYKPEDFGKMGIQERK